MGGKRGLNDRRPVEELAVPVREALHEVPERPGAWTTTRTTVGMLGGVLQGLSEAGEDVRFIVPDGAYLVVVSRRG